MDPWILRRPGAPRQLPPKDSPGKPLLYPEVTVEHYFVFGLYSILELTFLTRMLRGTT